MFRRAHEIESYPLSFEVCELLGLEGKTGAALSFPTETRRDDGGMGKRGVRGNLCILPGKLENIAEQILAARERGGNILDG